MLECKSILYDEGGYDITKACPKKETEYIQHKVAAKGAIISTLKTGGTIRGTGSKIHFSLQGQMPRCWPKILRP